MILIRFWKGPGRFNRSKPRAFEPSDVFRQMAVSKTKGMRAQSEEERKIASCQHLSWEFVPGPCDIIKCRDCGYWEYA